jgi:hypothetical protein
MSGEWMSKMKMTISRFVPFALLACGMPLVVAQTSQPQTAPAAGGSAVHTIALPPIAPPPLPDGPGRMPFMVQCGICHTQRYVTMQPPFSRKVWTDEVTKMINTYKAPVPADQVTTIVDYLVSIRGAEPGSGVK